MKTYSPEEAKYYHDRVILTTYPGQVGIKPVPIHWAASDPLKRGPVLASRTAGNIKRRNALGAYSGAYCIYHALAVAIGALSMTHKPDYSNTEPPIEIPIQPTWSDPEKIVSFDPWGHLAPTLFKKLVDEENLDIRPTIAVTRAHMRVPEIEELVKAQKLKVDGAIVLNNHGELNVSKVAVDPVWYLPGVASRFEIDEISLRRALL